MNTASPVGLPRRPQADAVQTKVEAPKGQRKNSISPKDYQHFHEVLLYYLGTGIRNLPQIARTIVLPLGIVTVLNIVLESINNYMLFGFAKNILMLAVFLSATYNSIIPRTLFWIIIFTIGKKLFFRARKDGVKTVMIQLKTFIPKTREALAGVGNWYVQGLLMASGVGFIAANFLTRNNRFDKVLVTYVLAIAILDAMTKGTDGMLYTAIRLAWKDVLALVRSTAVATQDHVTVLLSGFTLGLVANTIFAVVKLSYGGYILGSMILLGSIVMGFSRRKVGDQNQD